MSGFSEGTDESTKSEFASKRACQSSVDHGIERMNQIQYSNYLLLR